MNVGELKKALEDVDDDLEVVITGWGEDDDEPEYVGTAEVANVEPTGEGFVFAIDCLEREDEEEAAEEEMEEEEDEEEDEKGETP